MIEIIITSIYALTLGFIFIYALTQFSLLLNYLRSNGKKENVPKYNFSHPDEVPLVTIQLPLYNEYYVVERLLKTVAELQYPAEKLQIQVLDDSTDNSLEYTRQQVKKLRQKGVPIEHVYRHEREGFKAGALRDGLQKATGKFVVIFDADFMPNPDFLQKTIPYFKDEKIGVVQTRWGHLNRNFSILTKIQAFALDAHFTFEQAGRNAAGHFINFNGTAGVWRKACIEDAGNWKGDTLTEDLDLSYRAQMKGWKFKYLGHVETPAELPVAMSAAKTQQFRWNKGGAENFRKMKWKLLFNRELPLKTRFHGMMHLLNSSIFLIVFLMALLSIPMLYIKKYDPEFTAFFNALQFFNISTVLFFFCYWYSYKHAEGVGSWRKFWSFTKEFITFFAVSIGLSLHNSMAVLEGHLGKRSSFIRTPKFNVLAGGSNQWKKNKYITSKITWITFLEGLMVLYFLFGIFSAVYLGDFGLIHFHLLLLVGFFFIFYHSIRRVA